MSAKAALKAVRSALDSKDFELAATKAKEIVDQDPTNYHANVFLGLAQDKLGKPDQAEKAYVAATRIKDNDKTAWQGLINLYMRMRMVPIMSLFRRTLLTTHYDPSDERDRCVDVVDKHIKFAGKNGSRTQQKQALQLQLPTCPLYNCLEGRVPHPADTYLRLIEIAEAEEKEFINREIGERRTRLGAKIDQVTTEVKREAFKRTELDEYYRGVIDWSNDDDVRHKYEEKLLQRAYNLLLVLPWDQKPAKREEVYRSARDMVIIKRPFDLAWKIVLEWQDAEDFTDWDISLLREFTEFFPEDGLSKVLQGFFTSDISPFPKETPSRESKQEETNGENAEMAVEDRLILMADGLEHAPSSIIAHRIMGQLYLSLEEDGSAVDVMRKGLLVVKDLVKQTGLNLRNTTDAINITLATALISYQSPRNHPEAKGIFEDILKRKPTNTSCLLGVGLILEEDQDYGEAVDFLQRALERDPSNLKIQGELSWCKALNGDLEAGLEGLQRVLDEIQSTKGHSREFKAEIHYRVGHCQWELDPSPSARRDRNGAYASFLASIQSDMNYAPAYTSLGIFYADYKKDKGRARRCFHKAFELSSSEIEAAERLARAFADQQEWDLVEAVAQRVVDSGKAKPAPGSKRKGHSWPYAALGVVQINRQQYTKSIVSYQTALRISPDDYHSWVGLGESYHHSGRYIAATKAFEHAEALEENLSEAEKSNTWFARYMLANVKRELGDYEDAITRYENVLKIRPNEFGVLIALLQTLTESAWRSIESGLFNDAAERAHKAILTATEMAKERPKVFNLWKAVADACSIFSYIKDKAVLTSISDIHALLGIELDESAFDILADTDDVGRNYSTLLNPTDEQDSVASNACIIATILACKRAVFVCADDVHAQAVSWYNLGWAEYRAYRSIELGVGKREKKQPRKFLKAAIRCFKRAIELEAGNSEFWNALGVVTSTLSPKVAQHAFVRSLHLNDRSAQNWTNIGAFYLIHNDLQLSNQAFTRAQSADPDYAHAWLGQGFLALLFGDPVEARALFTHAYDISSSSAALPKRQYTLSLFDHLLHDPSMSNEISQLIQPFFALHQLHCQEPSDLAFEHLSALLAERIGEFADAESSLRNVCAGVEAEYDVTESSSALARFAQANADIARAHLANYEYEAAAEKAETALTLSGEEDAAKFDPETIRKLRLSAHLTAGLAYYYLKSMDQAIDMFRDALQEADNAPEVVCLLAQVLWAKGGEEERNVTREQLLDCIEKHPDHVGAVTLLGAIALLDADQDAIEAVQADLQTMRTREDVEIHDRSRVVKLLSAISAMGFSADKTAPEDERRIAEATTAVMLAPGQPHGWMELAATTGELHPAKMAVKTALRSVPPRGGLEAEDLCRAYVQTGIIGDSLRAVMVAPWRKEGWVELAHTLSESA
ncbi:Translation repressor/antiviral protein Ski3 [Rasamsonia emersonii CBS 393.64]|uniref:Translation repressor/antiviral protein Ski3 n=1 Tax=Rasamsonia emersonii (strain ATCC 16479 / CBS 393.64 / IMI 116815) TaxID=1408163 RepID=A0A0F4YPX4_RASE3|nr:Translation repressor/antiviral protein Ski3 [Rasamsonia emersonii CBS 393.64]KKA20304.1 Translation repressor/antiviral protein Ski3 [Rasamsonia emersonii CBS 393.64]